MKQKKNKQQIKSNGT